LYINPFVLDPIFVYIYLVHYDSGGGAVGTKGFSHLSCSDYDSGGGAVAALYYER